MIKLIIRFVVFVVLALIFVVLNPDVQDHKMAIKEAIEETTADNDDDEWTELKNKVRDKVIGYITTDNLEVQSYGLFSVGRIKISDETHVVSVGILGHVFTPGKDSMVQIYSKQ